MENFNQFLSALDGALSALRRNGKNLYRTAAVSPLHDKLKATYAQNLRQAAAKLTELDVDVMEDLMRVVKKLGKQSTPTDNGLDTRLKLTLDLIEHVISRTTPTTPDHLIWLFNKLYQGLSQIIPHNSTLPTAAGGVA